MDHQTAAAAAVTSIQTLPTVGETVELKCLISSPHLNGKRGEISTYVSDPDIHRYRVNILMEDGTRQVIGVRPQNISLLRGDKNQNNGFSKNNYELDGPAIHVLVPCHVDTYRRCAQFSQCVKSLSSQTSESHTIIVYVSGPQKFRDESFNTMRRAAVSRRGESHHKWVVIENEMCASDNEGGIAVDEELQRWKSLLSVSMGVNPNAWLMFLESCDMYHPLRVHFFRDNIGKMSQNDNYVEGKKVFSAGGKLLVEDSVASANLGRNAVLNMEDFLEGTSGDFDGDDLKGVTESSDENRKWHPLEYFDYCVETEFFQEFLGSITSNKSISPASQQSLFNVKFIEAITKVSPPPPHFSHDQQSWLYVHYRDQCDSNSSSKVEAAVTMVD